MMLPYIIPFKIGESMKQITDDEIKTIEGILTAIKARGDIPVPEPEPLPTTGKITVTSIPTGIWVELDSVTQGQTPITIENVLPGTHDMWFYLRPSYISQQKTVVVEAGKVTELSIALVPEPVDKTTLYLSTPPTGSGLSPILANGSNETSKLQALFNWAVPNGYKKISFPANKTIGITDSVSFPPNLEYEGNKCTLFLLDDSYIISDGYYTFNYYGSNDCNIHHLIFDGNMNKQTRPSSCNGIPLKDYYFPKCPNGGIVFQNANNVRFEYNEVKNYGGYMVEILKGDNAIIKNNTIHDGWQYGICLAGTSADFCNNATVSNNTIYRMGQVGIKLQHTSNSLISKNNIIIPNRYDLFSVPSKGSPEPTGIRLYSYDGANKYVTISDNVITGVSGVNNEIGVSSDDSNNTNIAITNNILNKCKTGIYIAGFKLAAYTGNVFNGCVTNSVGV
jgi:parallel beta-helix repeat protein